MLKSKFYQKPTLTGMKKIGQEVGGNYQKQEAGHAHHKVFGRINCTINNICIYKCNNCQLVIVSPGPPSIIPERRLLLSVISIGTLIPLIGGWFSRSIPTLWTPPRPILISLSPFILLRSTFRGTRLFCRWRIVRCAGTLIIFLSIKIKCHWWFQRLTNEPTSDLSLSCSAVFFLRACLYILCNLEGSKLSVNIDTKCQRYLKTWKMHILTHSYKHSYNLMHTLSILWLCLDLCTLQLWCWCDLRSLLGILWFLWKLLSHQMLSCHSDFSNIVTTFWRPSSFPCTKKRPSRMTLTFSNYSIHFKLNLHNQHMITKIMLNIVDTYL